MATQNFKINLLLILYREGKKIPYLQFVSSCHLRRDKKMSDACSLFFPFGNPWPSCLSPSQHPSWVTLCWEGAGSPHNATPGSLSHIFSLCGSPQQRGWLLNTYTRTEDTNQHCHGSTRMLDVQTHTHTHTRTHRLHYGYNDDLLILLQNSFVI